MDVQGTSQSWGSTILYDCVELGENVFLFDYNNMLSLALLIMLMN